MRSHRVRGTSSPSWRARGPCRHPSRESVRQSPCRPAAKARVEHQDVSADGQGGGIPCSLPVSICCCMWRWSLFCTSIYSAIVTVGCALYAARQSELGAACACIFYHTGDLRGGGGGGSTRLHSLSCRTSFLSCSHIFPVHTSDPHSPPTHRAAPIAAHR
jgi:hypothetical protein